MNELPQQIKRQIFKDYLFDEFIYMFKEHFKFHKLEFSKRIEIGWSDNNYQQFMLKMLQALEPRSYPPHSFLFEENEEVNEQVYVLSGSLTVGFKHNEQRFYYVKLEKKSCIGAYENMLSCNSEFYYRALSVVEGLGIRKLKLKPLLDRYPPLRDQLQKKVIQNYFANIKQPMLAYKKDVYTEVVKRQQIAKYQEMVSLEISESNKLFKQLMEGYENIENIAGLKSNEVGSNKELSQLETKLQKLAAAIYSIYSELDNADPQHHQRALQNNRSLRSNNSRRLRTMQSN